MGEVVLVTGGAGYIGSYVTRGLLARGRRVRVLDSFLYGGVGLEEVRRHPGLEIIRGDVCDRESVSMAVQGVSSAIALAALVGDAACDLDPERSMQVNYEATQLLLEACERARVRRLVFASSCSVYGANGSVVLTEESRLNPVSLYARTRLMSEELLLRRTSGIDVMILRMATVCGTSPRMRFDLMVNTMTAFAKVRGSIRVAGGEQWRPHVHVCDAADAFILAAEAPLGGTAVFNVGADEQNFTIAEVAEKVAARVPGVRVDDVSSNGDRRSYRVSFAHIREKLGFRPRFTVDDAISGVEELFATGAITDFNADRFHNAKWLTTHPGRKGAA